MSDDTQGLRDDIAFMRALAEEGRTPPVMGGAILFAAGVIFSVASLVNWVLATGLVAAPPAAYSLVWAAATAVYMILLFVLLARLKASPRARTPAQRAMGMAWAGVGWGFFTLIFSTALVCWRAHSAIPTMLIPSVILTLYGVAWSVAATVSGRRWIWMAAIGSYLGALATAFTSDQPVVLLVYAAALVLLAALPGLMLMRQEPSRAA